MTLTLLNLDCWHLNDYFPLVNIFRWLENKKVADRLIELRDNIRQPSKFWDKFPKSKQPQSKSYKNVQEVISGPFTLAKLKFFSFVSDIVEPFLKKYQSDKPMIPFMYEDLKDLVSRLLELFVKPTILEKNKTGKKMMKLNLYDKEILLSAEKINVGFAVESELNYWKKKVNVTAPQIKVFMKGVQRFLCAMVTKLFERSPFGSLVLLSAAMFDPNIPLNTSK